ncbi:hypothetical protein RJ639_012732 [Escallonia herrerae]|uniref:Transcription factor GTE4 n=1 Tax=Escallonia herrerae TaxID=1293975 RepID=A0AA89ARI1_9ASTE|nr:hypothetical protein RJ639_012732 [Escallonia herrerae]
MASGMVVGGGDGGNEGFGERERWAESKVYKRKSFKGLKNDKRNDVKGTGTQTRAFQDSGPPEQEVMPVGRRESLGGNAAGKYGFPRKETRVTISLTSRTKQELRDYRRKLEAELGLVRDLVKKIEGNDGGSDRGSVGNNGGVKRGPPKVASGLLNQLSISVLKNSQDVSDSVEKEKRMPKANQFYRKSDFLLAKDRIPPAESNKKSKSNGKKGGGAELGSGFALENLSNQVSKSCNSLLERLMKHKHGWVFNTPVDVKALGLHDYFNIIKHPMDLATVKSRLNENWYKTPREFAEDVRLTFSNAMTYNPKGQDVYVMAEQLSKIFEEKWPVIEADYMQELRLASDYERELATTTQRKAPPLPSRHPEMKRLLERSGSMTHPPDPSPKSMNVAHSGKIASSKKPKARDYNKREMTYDEKQKLSTNLQNLPSEKLEGVIQIIRKRNPSLCQNDDEIEVDIDCFDIETLWELDRFIINYRKYLSKNRKKAEVANQVRGGSEQNVQDKNPAPAMVQTPKETKTDGKNTSPSSPIQVGKQGNVVSRSGSSSGPSSNTGSSSSGSDSESPTGNGSDVGPSPRT